MEKSKINVFYSWQSDVSKETNQNGIRLSIKSAIPLIEALIDDLDITLDEATSNTPGSPYIPGKIVEKISRSDVFICDLTPIGESFDKKKKIANPNVLIELGHAIAELGWDRIIILLNTNYGKLPEDLPFDVDKHRVSPFKIYDKSDKSGKVQLTQLLKDAIKLIIEEQPLKPHKKENINTEEKKRNLDIENLERLLSSIHLPTFDFFLEEVPDSIVGNIFHYFEGYKSIMRSSTFHIYDKEILDFLEKIYANWETLLSYGHRYDNTGNSNMYKFFFPKGEQEIDIARSDLYMLFEEKVELTKNFKELLNSIREKYLEIDLIDTSKRAFEDYTTYQLS